MRRLAILLLLTLIGCNDDEPQQEPYEGTWQYSSIDDSGVKPAIQLAFRLNRNQSTSGHRYIITNSEMIVDGVKSTDLTGWMSTPDLNWSMKTLMIKSSIDSVMFTNIKVEGNKATSESAAYMKSGNVITYTKQELMKK